MESTFASAGFFFGMVLNIFLQYMVWRYVLVFYSLGGDKQKYRERQVAYSFFAVLLGMVTYPFLWIIGAIFWPLVLVVLVGFIYFAVTLSSKWSGNELLPDPFKSSAVPSTAPPSTAPQNASHAAPNSQPVVSSLVSEDAFFVFLEAEGVEKARELLQRLKQENPNKVIFQESQLNDFAYKQLKRGASEFAVKLFALNVEAFPHSANCCASLANAYEVTGRKDEALSLYRKSLELLVTDRSRSEHFRYTLLQTVKRKIRELPSVPK